MENLITYLFLSMFGNWVIMSCAGVAVLLFYRRSPEFYAQMWGWLPWRSRWILLAAAGILAIQIREIIAYPFIWIQIKLPTYTLAEQLFFYLSTVHVRSILFYSLMIFYLWRKMGRLLPGLIAGWFWIGFVELTFIAQHWIVFQGFLGWFYYAPFLAIMIPLILDRRKFTFSWPGSLFLAAALFMQYVGVLLVPWAVMSFDTSLGYIPNVAAQPHPQLLTYGFEAGQHLMKTLFTVAGCFLCLKQEDGKPDE